MIRVFLVDDQAMVRTGIAMVVEAQDDMRLVGEAGTARRRWNAWPSPLPMWSSWTCACLVWTGSRRPGDC
jgi:hypothetical protein